MSKKTIVTWFNYENWLVERIGFEENREYRKLIGTLHSIPFLSRISRDRNREDDGLMLREEFCSEMGLSGDEVDQFTNERPCSVLEMLIALAIRVDNEWIGDPGEAHPEEFFWEMLVNLGLAKYHNRHFHEFLVENIVLKWLDREFEPDGKGSIFPLKHPHRDQRNIEIWSQMLAYVNENY